MRNNYIHQLQATVKQLQDELSRRNEVDDRLRSYLLLPKFSCGDELDGYVNIQDVLNRLEVE